MSNYYIVTSTCIYLCVAECWVEVPEAARCWRSADAAVWFLWACHLHLWECHCKFTKLCSHLSQARGDRCPRPGVAGVPGQWWLVSQARGDWIFALSTWYYGESIYMQINCLSIVDCYDWVYIYMCSSMPEMIINQLCTASSAFFFSGPLGWENLPPKT